MSYLKNAILRTFGLLNAVSFIFFACLVDSKSWIPAIICTCNIAYLILFFYANDAYFSKRIA